MSGMISYSIESNARRTVTIICTVVSLLIAFALNMVLMPCLSSWLSTTLADGTVALLATIGVSGSIEFVVIDKLLNYLFDNWLWKWPVVIKRHHVPNLNGEWFGYATGDERYEPQEMTMTVVQTFSKMSCCSKFPTSSSYATVIGVFACGTALGSCELRFAYENQVKGIDAINDKGRDNEHRGFNALTVEGNRMEGPYFTFRNEQTKGYIELERKGA